MIGFQMHEQNTLASVIFHLARLSNDASSMVQFIGGNVVVKFEGELVGTASLEDIEELERLFRLCEDL